MTNASQLNDKRKDLYLRVGLLDGLVDLDVQTALASKLSTR